MTSFSSATGAAENRIYGYMTEQARSHHLYSLKDGRAYRVTDEYTHSFEPQFDPEGKFLYWIADSRIHVEDSYWDGGHYRINPSAIVAATLWGRAD
jgi:hypothetical protein